MNSPHGRIRIIGGHWRGTRLDVPASPGLRPTSDRVRETLFNWLMPYLPGARVIDVFAGTGALGLEALSRGAAEAVLLERDPALAAALASTLARLPDAQGGRVVRSDALAWLGTYAGAPFDIAFVDPPFGASMWRDVWPALAPRLAPGALVHVEAPHGADAAVPADWSLHREGRTREVRHALYRVPAASAPAATLGPDRAAGEPPTAQ
ncbi:16S rRNA (guanine(966)-N(2))-methyltransferase RsmD [Lysobacter humi (ex Lee et al. 2017)]